MIRKKIVRPKRIVKLAEFCFFCKNGVLPDYKQPDILKNYITERGKISSREYTSICTKHQRYLAREIKRARFLALLPFVNQIK